MSQIQPRTDWQNRGHEGLIALSVLFIPGCCRGQPLDKTGTTECRANPGKERAGGCGLFRNGEGGIRTLGTIAGTSVFETDAFDHSATSPVNSPVSYGPFRGPESQPASTDSGYPVDPSAAIHFNGSALRPVPIPR